MPRYNITVKPGSSQEKVVEVDADLGKLVADSSFDSGRPAADSFADASSTATDIDGSLTVYLRAKPHDGEANAALVKLLAKHFKVPKTTIKILRGAKSRTKLVEF